MQGGSDSVKPMYEGRMLVKLPMSVSPVVVCVCGGINKLIRLTALISVNVVMWCHVVHMNDPS